ncbi:DNA-binding protein [Flavobacteriales bacterium 33_180_T64]|nr:DNA-binding protein [Flavobacteriales bacterium 33_180_T64]
MKPLKEFKIPFIGLKEGKHHFDYQIDKKFFEHFEYDDFNDVDVNTEMLFEKKATLLELHFEISGVVNVNCDLTNEPYNQTVKGDFKLVVKFGDDYNDEFEDILIVPHGEYEINIAQYIYELIILSMPAKRVHPGVEDGTLDSEILKKLEELSPKDLEEKEETSGDIDPRWNTLKKLLTDK